MIATSLNTLDILIPHYNDPLGLKKSLNSIAEQTWAGSYRVVVVDDGSPAPALAEACRILDEFDGNVVLIKNDRNLGRPRTRNILLDSIQSEYVSWLDAGDEWYPDKLEVQFDTIRLSAVSETEEYWVTCNYDWAWDGGKRKKNIQKTDQDQLRALLIGSSLRAYLWTIVGCSKSFKRVGWFDENLPRLQDLDYFIRFVRQGGKLINTEEKHALCVYNKSDYGRNAREVRSCNMYIYKKYNDIYKYYGSNFERMRLYRTEMLAARYAQNNYDNKLRWKYIYNAFRLHPLQFTRHFLKKGTRI